MRLWRTFTLLLSTISILMVVSPSMGDGWFLTITPGKDVKTGDMVAGACTIYPDGYNDTINRCWNYTEVPQLVGPFRLSIWFSTSTQNWKKSSLGINGDDFIRVPVRGAESRGMVVAELDSSYFHPGLNTIIPSIVDRGSHYRFLIGKKSIPNKTVGTIQFFLVKPVMPDKYFPALPEFGLTRGDVWTHVHNVGGIAGLGSFESDMITQKVAFLMQLRPEQINVEEYFNSDLKNDSNSHSNHNATIKNNPGPPKVQISVPAVLNPDLGQKRVSVLGDQIRNGAITIASRETVTVGFQANHATKYAWRLTSNTKFIGGQKETSATSPINTLTLNAGKDWLVGTTMTLQVLAEGDQGFGPPTEIRITVGGA